MAANTDELIAALRFSGAIEFGSRALGVHSHASDYDFAILEANFINLGLHKAYKLYDVSKYFKVIPATGRKYMAIHQEFIKFSTMHGMCILSCDILVVEHQASLDTIERSINELKLVDKSILQDKATRIKLYEDLLLKHGFVHSSKIAHRLHLTKQFIQQGLTWTLKNCKSLLQPSGNHLTTQS